MLTFKSQVIISAMLCMAISGCNKKTEKTEEKTPDTQTLFNILPTDSTHVDFSNTLSEGVNTNILTYQYFYNGGGVAIGDVNNDGLQDLYFSGNMSINKLYLNKGNLHFENVTEKAAVAGRLNAWKTGVTMADVNGDGLLDIYVCFSGPSADKDRVNQLFINEGTDDKGIPHFKEEAAKYGLADDSYSTTATFFDYDRDNDLDMFLLNHNPVQFNNLDDISIREILKKPEGQMRSKLYRNDGGSFKDISITAGLYTSAFSYGLGAGIADFNGDGWPDIYVSNDYAAPDFLYLNNGNGTFTDKLKSATGHTSIYSMGNDVSDINNDGLPDVYELDMLPEDNRRQKQLFAPDNYEYFNIILKAGFHYQYMRNTLQLNNGNGTFSEIGQLAGISNTDWSWAPLFADYDNDGWKDLFVSNGFLRDFTNMDFLKFKSSFMQKNTFNGRIRNEALLSLVNKMPSSNVNNYIYKNNGDLTFSNKGLDWGVNIPSNSNGAAFADLDNDGDLDLVTNNINQPAFIYKNNANQLLKNHYLQVKLKGNDKNTAGIGAKITLYSKGKIQYQEQMPSRGYQSCVTSVLHFGLGDESAIDSLRIVWLNGKQQLLLNVAANQVLSLSEKDAASVYERPAQAKPIFKEVPSPVVFESQKNTINDFKRQPLLVNPMSFQAPCLAKADVNGDGLEDIFVGGASGKSGALFLQQKSGNFILKKTADFEKDKLSEDADAIFVDVNNDQKPDLYVSSGGYANYLPNDILLQDRLYLNDGKGNFTKSKEALPEMLTSKSCVRAADINNDGFADLYVGSRVVPGRYPETAPGYLLINDGKGRFKNNITSLAPQLESIGMVTDATCIDLNGDKVLELVLVGEWMPVSVFKNEGGKLRDVTDSYFDKKYNGWWNKLTTGDFNKDGKPDLIIGNQGLNTQCKASDSQPAELYFKDFDNNGSIDPVLCFYIQGVSYPYVTRDELLDQMSMMRVRYADYTSYADAGLINIFTPEELKDAGHMTANYLKTAYFESGAQGKFVEKPLPIEAQVSPVYAINLLDFDKDGNQDILMCGNINQARLRFGKYDANYGVLLKGDGNGKFSYVPQTQSGFQLKGDVRSILNVGNILLFGINQQNIKAYKLSK